QILKLLRKWIDIDPKNFPKLLANTLVSLSESSEDLIKKAVIENLRKLAISNPELAAWSGAIRILVDAIIDPLQTRQTLSEGIAAANHAPITKPFSVGVIQT
ncbi:MAG: hypothetical protein EOO39_38615, partial [Cytophagaceae bacterium]